MRSWPRTGCGVVAKPRWAVTSLGLAFRVRPALWGSEVVPAAGHGCGQPTGSCWALNWPLRGGCTELVVLGARGWAWRQVSHTLTPAGSLAPPCPPLPAPPTQPWGVPQTAVLGDEDEDEADDDFVEVPEKEGYEACVPAHLWPEDGEWRGALHGASGGS